MCHIFLEYISTLFCLQKRRLKCSICSLTNGDKATTQIAVFYTAFEVIYMDVRYYRYAVANLCHTGKQSGDILPTSAISMTLDHSLRNESARRRHADLPESCLVRTVNHLLKSFQLQSVVKSLHS